MHDTEGLRNSAITIRQRCVCEKRSEQFSFILEIFQKQDSDGNCVDGKNVQTFGPIRIGKQEVGSQRPRTCLTDGPKGRLLGGRESYQELAVASCTIKQSSDPAEPPNSTKAIPRMSSSRTAVHCLKNILYLVRMSCFAHCLTRH